MKSEKRLTGRSTKAIAEPMRAKGIFASSGDAYGDQTDEFDAIAFEDEGILDADDSDISDWCDAQDVARELAGRAWH